MRRHHEPAYAPDTTVQRYLDHGSTRPTYDTLLGMAQAVGRTAERKGTLQYLALLGDICIDLAARSPNTATADSWLQTAGRHYHDVKTTVDYYREGHYSFTEDMAATTGYVAIHAAVMSIDLDTWQHAVRNETLDANVSYRKTLAALTSDVLPYAAANEAAYGQSVENTPIILAQRAGYIARHALARERHGTPLQQHSGWKAGIAATPTAAAFFDPSVKLQIKAGHIHNIEEYRANGIATVEAHDTGLSDITLVLQGCLTELPDMDMALPELYLNPDVPASGELDYMTDAITARIRLVPSLADFAIRGHGGPEYAGQ